MGDLGDRFTRKPTCRTIAARIRYGEHFGVGPEREKMGCSQPGIDRGGMKPPNAGVGQDE